MRPSVHVRAHIIRGRILCRVGGRRQEAAASFESAANTANQYAYWLLELMALRDMKTYLVDNAVQEDGSDGTPSASPDMAEVTAAADASARIGSVLSRISAEAQKSQALETLMGSGWSVEELLLCAATGTARRD